MLLPAKGRGFRLSLCGRNEKEMSAMRQLVLVLAFLCVISTIAAINFDNVDARCTIECAGYWLATIRNGDARYPSGCECSKFAI
uniref:Uncharacterized protein n=1 Tax=Ascaris lumbricoides TaxID=6252 RepID=A0A0M3I7L5_ASCLU